MSDELSRTESATAWRGLHLAIECIQLLIAGLLLHFMLFADQQPADPTWIVGLLRAVIIMCLLLALVRSQGWLLLLAAMVHLFVTEPAEPSGTPGGQAVLYVFAVLALLAFSYRYRRTQRTLGRAVNAAAPRIDAALSFAEILRRGWEGVLRWLGVLVPVLAIATLAVAYLPFSPPAREFLLQRSLQSGSLLLPGASVMVLLLAVLVVTSELSWRQLTRGQAAIYARANFMTGLHRDWKMIALRRQKATRKAARRERKARTIKK